LIQKWPKAYPKAKHTNIFPSYSWSEAETIRRLKSMLYDVKTDIEDCEKRLASEREGRVSAVNCRTETASIKKRIFASAGRF